MRKRAQFDGRCERMRRKYAVPSDPALKASRERIEREQAFVYGYQAGTLPPHYKRPKNPFSDERLQRAWRRGFAIGRKGLQVKLKLP